MMNFIERVTGSDITKAMKNLSVRIQNLSPAYQDAWDEMQSCLYTYGDFTGRNLLPVFENLAELLEIASAENQSVEEILGSDIKTFCSSLFSGEEMKTYRDKWRRQLNQNVERRLGRLK